MYQHKPLAQRGFSLLEVLLSLSLVSGILLASQTSLHNLWHQAGWWLMLNNITNSQWQAHQVFTKLNEQACGNGLASTQTHSWQLYLNREGACELHDIRYVSSKGYWQKRRRGGRFTTFLGDVQWVSLAYGVAPPGECYVSQWLTQVPQDQLPQVVMLRLTLKTGVDASVSPQALPSGWTYETPPYLPVDNHSTWLWQPLSLVLPLPC